MSGPLTGTRIVELAAIGPAPFGVMLLADLGAEVIRIDRPGGGGLEATMIGLSRNRRSVAVDLKREEGRDLALALIDTADVVIEGFRPGVAERLGIGPEVCRARNRRLVYGRMTGWGQEGPWSHLAGHDIDYAAVAGGLHPIGRADDTPPPPINYLADFGGGGAYLAIGVLAALVERAASGEGQVVDAAMVDGVASLSAFLHGLVDIGAWTTNREDNLLDGGAPFYDTYRTADDRFVAVGAIEPQFFAELLQRLELDPADFPQLDKARWPEQKKRLAEVFASRTRDEWAAVFADSDACVAPVLDLLEARGHPHLTARGTFVQVDGMVQPAPAPRLSRTPGEVRTPPPAAGQDTEAVLRELGYPAERISALRAAGVIG